MPDVIINGKSWLMSFWTFTLSESLDQIRLILLKSSGKSLNNMLHVKKEEGLIENRRIQFPPYHQIGILRGVVL